MRVVLCTWFFLFSFALDSFSVLSYRCVVFHGLYICTNGDNSNNKVIIIIIIIMPWCRRIQRR